MNKYTKWDDEIKAEDLSFLKVYASGERNYFSNNVINKEFYQKIKIKNFKSKKKYLNEVFEAMLAFHIMDEDTLKKPDENNRKYMISKLSDPLLLELVDVLSMSLELSEYEYFKTKYTTEERKEKYPNIYLEIKKYEDFLSKLSDVKKIKDDISFFKDEIKIITNKQYFESLSGDADNYNTYENDIDIYFNLLYRGILREHENINDLKIVIDNIKKENEELMLNKQDVFDSYQVQKLKIMKEMASLENKVNKIVQELKSEKYEIYDSKFYFQNLSSHNGFAERVVSNIIISKEHSDYSKFSSNTKGFLNLLMQELLKRDLMSQASKIFASPYILLDEKFSKRIDYMNFLSNFFNELKNKKVQIKGFDVVRTVEYDIDELTETLKDLNILWESLDSRQKFNYSEAVLEVVQGNINYSIENDFVICDGRLEDLLLEALKNSFSYNNELMLSVAKKIMLYREDVINFNLKNNSQKNKMEIDFEKYFELLGLLEKKYPNFKEKNKEFYLPSTQLILSDEVVFDTRPSLEVTVDIKSLIGLQNKQFKDYPFLTRDKFVACLNKFWKSAVLENEIMTDFIAKDYLINEKEQISFFVKSIPSLNMNNEQLNNWANKFLSKLLIESDWRNLKETVNIPYKIEELSQKELLEIDKIRVKHKVAVKKF